MLAKWVKTLYCNLIVEKEKKKQGTILPAKRQNFMLTHIVSRLHLT